jgi:hypothetical protein
MVGDVLVELERHLAPLRQIDWSGLHAQPVGLLEQEPSFWSTRRYSSIPIEAMPILSLGVDGWHYALWIDDRESVLRLLGELVEQGRRHHALVVARNAIARSTCTMTRGFGNALAAVYRALGQTEYAELAFSTHEPTDEALERFEKINAMMAKRFGPEQRRRGKRG